MISMRVRWGLLVGRLPAGGPNHGPQLIRCTTGDIDHATTFRHQARYCISYAWPSAWQRGETPNKRARRDFAPVLPGFAPGGLRTNCLSGFRWVAMLQLASASKTFLSPCRRASRTAIPARSYAWAGSKGQILDKLPKS
jgi:hypothetical protein